MRLAAERAVNLKQDSPEYQRILGTLCGQMISSNGIAALKYGKCALNAVNKALASAPGTRDLSVRIGRADLQYDPTTTDPARIANLVNAAGYRATPAPMV